MQFPFYFGQAASYSLHVSSHINFDGNCFGQIYVITSLFHVHPKSIIIFIILVFAPALNFLFLVTEEEYEDMDDYFIEEECNGKEIEEGKILFYSSELMEMSSMQSRYCDHHLK